MLLCPCSEGYFGNCNIHSINMEISSQEIEDSLYD